MNNYYVMRQVWLSVPTGLGMMQILRLLIGLDRIFLTLVSYLYKPSVSITWFSHRMNKVNKVCP